jgi:hypothetical protein
MALCLFFVGRGGVVIEDPWGRQNGTPGGLWLKLAGGLRVDDQLEFARLHDRKFRGLRTFEDAAFNKERLRAILPPTCQSR